MGGPFAIYLNANARRVSPDVVARIEELVHPDDIYYCNTPEDAAVHGRRIVERGYATVFTGGGDGTVTALINALSDATGGLGPAFPCLGVLSLGTGNAISRMVSSGSAIQDLKAYVSNPSSDVQPLSLLRCEGRLLPFASIGIDAQILADYQVLKKNVASGPLKPIFQNVGGYFVAFFGATGPRLLARTLRGLQDRVRVVMLAPGVRLGPAGEPLGTVGAGEVVYEGPFKAVIAGTVPFYGYGMRLLPWADRDPAAFQLRIATIGVAKALAEMPRIWKGTFEGSGFVDFHATSVRVECLPAQPYQGAGDLVGTRDAVEFDLAPRAVRLLRFI
jgi:diacylglycerol kinase family enzyme